MVDLFGHPRTWHLGTTFRYRAVCGVFYCLVIAWYGIGIADYKQCIQKGLQIMEDQQLQFGGTFKIT
jgi:hypothetical protein